MELLHWCHDHFTSDHLGLSKTYERLKSIYFWIKSCVSCTQNKRDVHHSKPPLLPIAVSGLWEVIATDCMCPLPATNLGNRYVLIIGNLFTKVHRNFRLDLNRNNHNHSGVFGQNCISTWPTSQILTDRGTNFTSKLMERFEY